MRKITLEDKHNDRKLTLYIADDAFNGSTLPAETQESILRIIAEKMFKKLSGKQIIYLSKISLPNADQPSLSFEYNEAGKILRATIKDLTPSDQTDQIEIHDLSEPGFAYSLPQNTERDQYKKILLAKNVCTEAEVDHLVSYLADDPAKCLRSVKQTIFSDIPENTPGNILKEMHDFVDGMIATRSESISNERGLVVKWVQEALDSSYAYYTAILPLASQLYDAAKSYYLDMWKLHGNNFANLQKEREAFNKLFNGIAYIDEDLNLSSIAQTMDALRSKDAPTLESMISELLHNAYTNNKPAFTHLTNKLLPDSAYTITGTFIPWSYKFSFTKETNDLYEAHKAANNNINHIAFGGLKKLVDTIHLAEKDVRDRAEYIKQDKQPEISNYFARQRAAERKNQKNEGTFFQRNKATIISLCVGAAIAVGAGVAIALAPIALPTLAVGFIIAGAAALIMGAAAVIGRIIDKCKPAAKAPVSVTPAESQRLLDDFDAALKPESTGKSVPFLTKRSAHSNNNLFKDNTAGITPAAATNVSVSTLKL